MKYLLLLIPSVVLVCCGKNDNKTISNKTPWSKGKETIYKAFIENVQYSNDSIVDYKLNNVFFMFNHLESDTIDNLYEFIFRPYYIKEPDTTSEFGFANSDSLEFYDDFKFLYKTNDEGLELELINKNEIITQTINSLKKVDSTKTDFDEIKEILLSTEETYNRIYNMILPYHFLNAIPLNYSSDSIYQFDENQSYFSLKETDYSYDLKQYDIVIDYDETYLNNSVQNYIDDVTQTLHSNKKSNINKAMSQVLKRSDSLSIVVDENLFPVLTVMQIVVQTDSIKVVRKIVSDYRDDDYKFIK